MKIEITQCFIDEDKGFDFQIAKASDNIFNKGRWIWLHIGKVIFSFFIMWNKR